MENDVDNHKYMLETDDTLFLNVSVDSKQTNSSIDDFNGSVSSNDSPEVNLNSALIVPKSVKRKSTDGISTTCKKRLLDDVSFGETSITDTELLQIDTFEQFSQRYFNSQFKQVENIIDEDVRTETQIQRTQSIATKLNLTQIFNDDFEDDIHDMVMPCNQSQMFMEAVKAIGQVPIQPTQKLEELNGTTYKSKNGNVYIELQRSKQAENETNVIDDDFVGPELSQAIKSTQYLQEIEDAFVQCEESICNVDNLNESSRSIDMNVAMNMSSDPLHGLNEINWNSPLMVRTPIRTPPSSLIKNRLAMFSKNKENVAVKTRPIVSTKFSPMGNFFGLPATVKSLIREYKGIDELYGRRVGSFLCCFDVKSFLFFISRLAKRMSYTSRGCRASKFDIRTSNEWWKNPSRRNTYSERNHMPTHELLVHSSIRINRTSMY